MRPSPCSGLGERPCERRGNCANFMHWTENPRSAFNLCTPLGPGFKRHIPIVESFPLSLAAAPRLTQATLF